MGVKTVVHYGFSSRTSSLLWTIDPPQGQRSWLFGTMHIRDDKVYRLCDSLYPLILQSSAYVGEMDLDPDLTSTRYVPPYDMQAFFRPAVFDKIRKQILKSYALDIQRYNHVHPLIIMSAITQNFLPQDHLISMDEHLWNFAKDHEIRVQGLESANEQLALLHSIAPEAMYKQIKAMSRKPSTFRRFGDQTLAYYINGSLHVLYQKTKASMHHLRKPLIYQRNARMVDRILAFPTDIPYFITVGAGHLSGPSGIISLLRKAGYKVKAVHLPQAAELNSSAHNPQVSA